MSEVKKMNAQESAVEHCGRRVRDSLADLEQMAVVESLWEEDITCLKNITELLEGLVAGTVDAGKLNQIIS